MEEYHIPNSKILPLIIQTDNWNYRNEKWENEYFNNSSRLQNPNRLATQRGGENGKNMATATKKEPTIGNKPLWKCSPTELRKFCADNSIEIQDGLRQYQLVNTIKEHFGIPNPKTNGNPDSIAPAGISLAEAQKIVDERAARAKKMVVPRQIPKEENKTNGKSGKRLSSEEIEKLKNNKEVKTILASETKKYEKIAAIAKLIEDKYAIAEILGTNYGHVWNVLKKNEKGA